MTWCWQLCSRSHFLPCRLECCHPCRCSGLCRRKEPRRVPHIWHPLLPHFQGEPPATLTLLQSCFFFFFTRGFLGRIPVPVTPRLSLKTLWEFACPAHCPFIPHLESQKALIKSQVLYEAPDHTEACWVPIFVEYHTAWSCYWQKASAVLKVASSAPCCLGYSWACHQTCTYFFH